MVLSGVVGLAAAYAFDHLVGPDGPTPAHRLLAATLWALAWTAVTRSWWIVTFYNAAGSLVGLHHPFPKFGAASLLAGWVFWAALLSAGIPSARRWRAAKRAQVAPSPGRLPPPPNALRSRPSPPPLVRPDDGTLLGLAHGGAPVVLQDAQGNLHVLVLGATGSGKTNALLLIVGAAIRRGHPVLVIDGKGSEDLCVRVEALATGARRDFRAFTFRGRHHWNPCRHADPTHLRDAIGAIHPSDNPHYQSVAMHYLGTITHALAAAGHPATLKTLAELCNPDLKALQALLRDIPDSKRADLALTPFLHLDESTKSGIVGLGHRLARLTGTTIGAWLEPAPDPAHELDLLECATIPEGPVGYFSLDSMQYPDAARDVGALVMQELQRVASELMARGNRRPVYLVMDEFSAFRTEQVLSLLNKGREPGLHCVLATQDLADLERTGGRTAVDQILANTATKLCLRVDRRETAEIIASTMGTRPTWQTAHRVEGGASTGQLTAQMREQPWLEPSVLMQQGPGEATLICKAPEISVRRLRLFKAG